MNIYGTNPSISRALNTISPKLGIIREIRRADRLNSDPETVTYSANTCDPEVFSDGMANGASGTGVNWKGALLAAVGEGVERYASSFNDPSSLVLASAEDLMRKNLPIIKPQDFALFHDQQFTDKDFPFAKFDDQTQVHWIEVMDITSSNLVYCPAIFFFMPFRKDEVRIAEQISTGFAVHQKSTKALIHAIYEIVERDAFMIAWTHLLDIPKIKIEGELADYTSKIVPSHLELHLLDMTTDLRIPSVMGILTGKHDYGELIVFCAASRFTLLEAAKKTALELCQSVPYYRYLLRDDRDYSKYENIKTFEDHSIFYVTRPDLWENFDHWLTKEETVVVPVEPDISDDEKLVDITQRFKEMGYPLLARESTTNDLDISGFSLVRAVCPHLIHLNGTYGQYYWGGKRLYEVPLRMGYEIDSRYENINRLPHPFP